MSRKKGQTTQTIVTHSSPRELPANTPAETATDDTESVDAGAVTPHGSPRSYKPTLRMSAKGVTLGARLGHDWVVSFPADPGKEVKDKLMAAGFGYGDKKWRVFTNAANRPVVAALFKDLKDQLGDEISVDEYAVNHVVLAFDAPPSEEIISRLREAKFYFRSDRTWNAEQSSQNQKFARDLIESLPDMARSAAAAR